MHQTYAAALKALPAGGTTVLSRAPEALHRMALDKGYDETVIRGLARRQTFGRMVDNLLLKGTRGSQTIPLEHVFNMLSLMPTLSAVPVGAPLTEYVGTRSQNVMIDRTGSLALDRSFVGEGAAGNYVTPFRETDVDFFRDALKTVPIAIIGSGAAGVMAKAALFGLGFENVVVYGAEPGGIWTYDHVRKGSRNNPRQIEFMGIGVAPAPGDGEHVYDFITGTNSRAEARRRTLAIDRKVSSIRFDGSAYVVTHVNSDTSKVMEIFADSTRRSPRAVALANDFKNRLEGPQSNEVRYAIVINAMGTGAPKSLHAPGIIETATRSAIRWQRKLVGQKVERKRLVMLGLGNSTAEMLTQIHDLQDNGVDIDYTVMTHYPRDAIQNPNDTIHARGQNFRVFRDLTRPNLTSFQGDLARSRRDYYRALTNDRIVGDVARWEHGNKKTGIWVGNRAGSADVETDTQEFYGLIGYRHTPDTFSEMGIKTCAEGSPLYDFDGEFIRDPNAKGRDRVYPGYFGLGAVLDAPGLKNNIVIPGMVFRMPDLMFGVLMRAFEWQRANAV